MSQIKTRIAAASLDQSAEGRVTRYDRSRVSADLDGYGCSVLEKSRRLTNATVCCRCG
jgi:hypothetical protein